MTIRVFRVFGEIEYAVAESTTPGELDRGAACRRMLRLLAMCRCESWRAPEMAKAIIILD